MGFFINYNLLKQGVKTQMQLSKYFTLWNFTKSTYADRHEIDNIPENEDIVNLKDLSLHLLDKIVDHFGRKITITSGYRSDELNQALGGAKKSQHTKGMASDFVIKGLRNLDVCKVIEKAFDFDQLILEPSWIHVSYNHKNNRHQVMRKDNSGYKLGLV